jgi:hypothetical protein
VRTEGSIWLRFRLFRQMNLFFGERVTFGMVLCVAFSYEAIQSLTDLNKLRKLEGYLRQEGFESTATCVRERLKVRALRKRIVGAQKTAVLIIRWAHSPCMSSK